MTYKYIKGTLKYDSKNLKRNQNGYLIVDALVAKVGIVSRYDYELNIQRNEYVSEEALFHTDSLETLKNLPVTQYHPEIDGKRILIDETNTLDFQRGFSIGNPEKYIDNNEIYLKIPIMIQDKQVIEDVLNNITPEISLGYTSIDINDNGTFKGKEYNFKQTNRINNHIALERNGVNRSGSDVRVKTDSKEEYFYLDKEDKKKMKMKLDSKEFEVDEVGHLLLESKFKADSNKIAELEKSNKELKEKLDSQEAVIDEQKETITKLDSYKLKVQSQEKESLFSAVKPILGEDYKFDSKTEIEIKKDVLLKIKPDLDLKQKTDSYIEARYDVVLENYKFDAQEEDNNKSLDIPNNLHRQKQDSKTSPAEDILSDLMA
jgi:hypothetical protein